MFQQIQQNMVQEITTTAHNSTALDAIGKMKALLQQGSLPKNAYEQFDAVIHELYTLKDSETFRDDMRQLRENYPAIGSDQTMQGLAFVKKHGYAGDYEIIDKIYTHHVSDHPEFRTWDNYFQQQAAPQAVRNRKAYFKEVLHQLASTNQSDTIHVLNLASGPCRDLLEFFQESKDLRFHFTCVELDPNAIAYATSLLGEYAEHVTFIQQNIFRFVPQETYDLVWSAGLFDYFDDNTFTKIIARFVHQPNVIIGNFSDTNPTNGYMEVIGEWFLHHRSAGLLRRLARDAGYDKTTIRITHEPSEINLFLTIKK
jgi:extracellular factor (EF) 3-hydroxypalmitic acid methyl ester biosynthesis protein